MSPHILFKEDQAKYAPNFSGRDISPAGKNFESAAFAASRKATLISIFSTQMAYRMCKPYLEAVEDAYSSHPDVGVVRIQFEDNWMKMALLQYYIKSKVLQPRYSPQQQVIHHFHN